MLLKIIYYKCCITNELIQVKELILLKVTAKNLCFATIGSLIMDSNFKILYAMVAMFLQCCVSV